MPTTRAAASPGGFVYCACHTTARRGPAATTRAAARPGASVYCPCHTNAASSGHTRSNSSRRLCVVHLPHDSPPQASSGHARRSSARSYTKTNRGPAAAMRSSARMLCVLHLLYKRQPRASGGHTRRNSFSMLYALRLPHERQPRASGGHARRSSARMRCVQLLQEALCSAPARLLWKVWLGKDCQERIFSTSSFFFWGWKAPFFFCQIVVLFLWVAGKLIFVCSSPGCECQYLSYRMCTKPPRSGMSAAWGAWVPELALVLMAWRAPISFSEFALVFMGWRIPTREAPTASPKSMPISGAKNEPSGHGKVLLREQQKDQQIWKHFPCTLPNFEACKRATFSA